MWALNHMKQVQIMKIVLDNRIGRARNLDIAVELFFCRPFI